MKEVDPDMKILWNDNGQSPERLKKFLEVAGDAVDGAEFHGKWPYGGQPKLPPGTYDEWLREVPLVERKSKQTWRTKITELRKAAKDAGRSNLLLANNEYGLGKPSSLVGFNRFTKSMVATEFALEMYVAGYDIAAFWDNSDGGSKDHDDQMLLATQEGYRFNPVRMGIEMLAQAAGLQMLSMTTVFTNPNVSVQRVHGFAASGNAGASPRIYLMNKMETPKKVQLQIPLGMGPLTTAFSMVDTSDHWGALVNSSVICAQAPHSEARTARRICEYELPAVSFTMLAGKDSRRTHTPNLAYV